MPTGSTKRWMLLPLCLWASLPEGTAHARRQRPWFEPEDLQMQQTGQLQVDLQFGMQRAQGVDSLSLPDVEVDLGILPTLELDLETTVLVDPAQPETRHLDIVWLSAKVGLWGQTNDEGNRHVGVGMQLGPRLGPSTQADGPGFEGLIIASATVGPHQVSLNAGVAHDPAVPWGPRSTVDLLGLDEQLSLDGNDVFHATGELFMVHHWDGGSLDVGGTAGLRWQAASWIELSATGLVGRIGDVLTVGGFLGATLQARVFGGAGS